MRPEAAPPTAAGLWLSAAVSARRSERTIIAKPADSLAPLTVSRDGKTVVMNVYPGGATRLARLNLEKPAEAEHLFGNLSASNATLSPDGRWLAYDAREGDRTEVYVRPFPNVGDGQWQVSTGGGLCPRWNPEGGELFYLEDSSLMAVEVESGDAFRSGAPTRVADGRYVGTRGGYGGFGVSPDGKRFLLYKEQVDAGEPRSELILVLNWFDELRERVPVR